jgi:hypothetical protein
MDDSKVKNNLQDSGALVAANPTRIPTQVSNALAAAERGLIVFRDQANMDLAQFRSIMQSVYSNSSALTSHGLPDVARVAMTTQGKFKADFLGPNPVVKLSLVTTATLDYRVFYENAYDGGGGQAGCLAIGKIIGHGKPGGLCAECELARFGSAPNGRGQACGERRMLYGHWAEDGMAIGVDLPPTSLKPCDVYFRDLRARLVPFYGLVTDLTVDTSSGYSVVNFQPGERLTRAQAEIARVSQEVLQDIVDRAKDAWTAKAQQQQ